jgi:hypothetical protein
MTPTPSRSDGSFTPRSTPGSATPRRETGARSSVKSSDWDYATPQVKASGYEEIALEYPEETLDGSDRMHWEEEQAQLDRDWYQMEENGATDDTHNPFAEYEVHDHEKEEELAKKQIVSLRSLKSFLCFHVLTFYPHHFVTFLICRRNCRQDKPNTTRTRKCGKLAEC